MNLWTEYTPEMQLDNAPLRIFDVGGLPVEIRALPIAEANEWCRGARKAMAAARASDRAQKLMQAATGASTASYADDALAAEAETATANWYEATDVYWLSMSECVADFLRRLNSPVKVESLTQVQMMELFEDAFQISDPSAAAGLWRLRQGMKQVAMAGELLKAKAAKQE